MAAPTNFTREIDNYIVSLRNEGALCSVIAKEIEQKFGKQFTTVQVNDHLNWLCRRGVNVTKYSSGYSGRSTRSNGHNKEQRLFSSSGKANVRERLERYARELKHKWPRKPIILCLPGRDGIDLPIYRKFNAEIHAVERDHKIAEFLRRNYKDIIVHECDLEDLTMNGQQVNFAFLDFCGHLARSNLAGLKKVIGLLACNSLLAVTLVATRWHEKHQRLSDKFGVFRKPYEASAHILADVLPNGYGLYDVRKFVYFAKQGFTMATVMGTFDRTLFKTSERELESPWVKV